MLASSARQMWAQTRCVKGLAAACLAASLFLFMSDALLSSAHAKDLGVRGHTFKIVEPSLVERISRELSSVDWKSINEGMADRAKDRFSNMPNASGLARAGEDRMRQYDLSFRVTKDIWAPQPDGNEILIARKGTVINPFNIRIPRTRFFFFNPKDEKQKKVAEEMYKKYMHRFIPVIVEGDIPGLIKEWGAQVYYAYPFVTKRFHVKRYPSLVGVKDKMLAVYEFDADEISVGKVDSIWKELD